MLANLCLGSWCLRKVWYVYRLCPWWVGVSCQVLYVALSICSMILWIDLCYLWFLFLPIQSHSRWHTVVAPLTRYLVARKWKHYLLMYLGRFDKPWILGGIFHYFLCRLVKGWIQNGIPLAIIGSITSGFRESMREFRSDFLYLMLRQLMLSILSFQLLVFWYVHDVCDRLFLLVLPGLRLSWPGLPQGLLVLRYLKTELIDYNVMFWSCMGLK